MTHRANVVVLLVAVGCGGRAAGPRDGSADAPPVSGLHAFDVTAFLRMARDGGVAGLPPSHGFTLVVDPDAGRVIAGGNGRGATVPVTTTDGRTFTSMGRFPVGFSSGVACSGVTAIEYTSFDITVTETTLRGTAAGSAQVSCGDCVFDEPFTATLQGVPDAKAPFLLAGAMGTTPFDGFAVLASEPLPAEAKAWVVAGDGSTVALVPDLEGAPLILAFRKPDVVLRPGDGYTVSAAGLIDVAGHQGSDDAPLRLTSFQAAPLVPEDGFETVVGATIGGANVIRGSGPLTPLTGTTSAYVGATGSPRAGGVAPSPSIQVRLALQPGDTKLRFAYRVVASYPDAFFGGTVHLGSVGHTPSSVSQLPAKTEREPQDWPGGPVFLSPVATAELELPADAQGELVFSIAAIDGGCGLFVSQVAMLVDDLLVE